MPNTMPTEQEKDDAAMMLLTVADSMGLMSAEVFIRAMRLNAEDIVKSTSQNMRQMTKLGYEKSPVFVDTRTIKELNDAMLPAILAVEQVLVEWAPRTAEVYANLEARAALSERTHFHG